MSLLSLHKLKLSQKKIDLRLAHILSVLLRYNDREGYAGATYKRRIEKYVYKVSFLKSLNHRMAIL